MNDLILQNLQLQVADTLTRLDLAVNFYTESDGHARIHEVGDLSVYSAYHQFDVSGLAFRPGKAYLLTQQLVLDTATHLTLLAAGYTHFTGAQALLHNHSTLPVLVNPLKPVQQAPFLQQGATFLLVNDQEKVVQVLLNGQLITLATAEVLNPLGT